ncbi:MAG: UDP-2,3-diacylglucosamine diphosphatase [Comamonadaceae bacterium]|nr:UDP-2,3-diacylglucosamine diphosphatase [Comamonadaceae bacterium]
MSPPPGPASAAGRVWPRLIAPARWQQVDVISDLHLKESDSATFSAWQHYLARTTADAVFILGDLFEVWVGDDVLDTSTRWRMSFEASCQQVLAHAAKRLNLYFMHGNRDFLLGNEFARGASMTLLIDPTALLFDQRCWLLTHGDALCLDDTDYQQFRANVRTKAWCEAFLAKPLAERKHIANGMRAQSESIKASARILVDLDKAAAVAWLQASGASQLIHGHTHQPGHEVLQADTQPPRERWVLSDWDANAEPPRLQVLRINAGQTPQRVRLPSGF